MRERIIFTRLRYILRPALSSRVHREKRLQLRCWRLMQRTFKVHRFSATNYCNITTSPNCVAHIVGILNVPCLEGRLPGIAWWIQRIGSGKCVVSCRASRDPMTTWASLYKETLTLPHKHAPSADRAIDFRSPRNTAETSPYRFPPSNRASRRKRVPRSHK